MNLLTLNIIPEAYETRFRMRRIYITARHLMLLLIIYMLFLGTLLLAARYILQREFTRIVNETSLVTADNRTLERKIEAMNNFLKDVSVAEKRHEQWAPLLIKMSEITPNGVVLSGITINEEKTASLTGTANSRSDLLSLKDELENISAIEKVDLPVSSLVEAVNVQFKIEFEIDAEKLNEEVL